ncbi:hypothetical protein [Lentzea pudingi]|nr:hypothetical protein [Lentzea pudingi]
MSAQRLTRIGVPLAVAGAVLLAGMIAVALTLPVKGIATWYVWVAVAAVALGPLWIGLVFSRSNEHQVGARFARPATISVVLAVLAGANVWDRYLTHPETPFTVSTVAYCVIAVVSVVLTVAALPALGPRLTPEELRTRPVDVRELHRWGRGAAVAGALSGVGLVVASPPGGPLPVVLGLVVAGCAVVAGVLLTRVADLRTGYRGHLVLAALLVVVLVSAVLAGPVGYLVLTSSVVGGISYGVLFLVALFVFLSCGGRLAKLLGQHGVLRPGAEVVAR